LTTILGKTSTTEFGVPKSGPATTNPHDPNRTPGDSSAGSAAAVIDIQGPLSIGVQSGGSIIRSASCTDIFAMKPSHNTISMASQARFSNTSDTTGFFARSIQDLELLAVVFDINDDESPNEVALEDMSVATITTPMWDQAGPRTIAAMEKARIILEKNGVKVEEMSLPSPIDDARVLAHKHTAIMSSEAQVALLSEYRMHKQKLTPEICGIVENANGIIQKERLNATDLLSSMRPGLDELTKTYSVILAPSTVDEAPLGLGDMGSPVFNTLWTVSPTHTIPSVLC
jgi:Asp-tRNA(Asn)/Glu-tRNA(Gln) amidotransferase A subunit family amidase